MDINKLIEQLENKMLKAIPPVNDVYLIGNHNGYAAALADLRILVDHAEAEDTFTTGGHLVTSIAQA